MIAAWGLVATLRIVAQGDCPGATQLTKHLLVLDATVQNRQAVVWLTPFADRLRVEVRSDTGSLFVVQDLKPGPGHGSSLQPASSCDTLAFAAAVVVVTALGTGPAESPMFDLLPRPISLPTGQPARPKPSPVHLEWGFFAALDWAWPRPGGGGFALFELSAKRPALSRLGLLLLVGGTSLKQQPMSVGSVDYTRLPLSLGLSWRLTAGAWEFAPLVLFSPSVVLVYGRDLPASQFSHGFDVGLGGGLRATGRWGSWCPFVLLQAAGFVREQRLSVVGQNEVFTLPAYSVSLGLGLSFGSKPPNRAMEP